MAIFCLMIGFVIGFVAAFVFSFVVTVLQAKLLFDDNKNKLDMFEKEYKITNGDSQAGREA